MLVTNFVFPNSLRLTYGLGRRLEIRLMGYTMSISNAGPKMPIVAALDVRIYSFDTLPSAFSQLILKGAYHDSTGSYRNLQTTS